MIPSEISEGCQQNRTEYGKHQDIMALIFCLLVPLPLRSIVVKWGLRFTASPSLKVYHEPVVCNSKSASRCKVHLGLRASLFYPQSGSSLRSPRRSRVLSGMAWRTEEGTHVPAPWQLMAEVAQVAEQLRLPHATTQFYIHKFLDTHWWRLLLER